MLLVAGPQSPFHKVGHDALLSGKDGLNVEDPGSGETPAEVSFLSQESEGLRPAESVHSCFEKNKIKQRNNNSC